MHDFAPLDEQKTVASMHVGIIMDGNGRWAKERGLPRLEGHRRGVEALRRVCKGAPDLGVKYITVYAFSSENWSRPQKEVLGLMRLFDFYLQREIKTFLQDNVRVRFLGERNAVAQNLQQIMHDVEHRTSQCTGLNLTIAVSYGARAEITHAARHLALEAARGAIKAEEINEESLHRALMTASIPDPDLIIRTGGEERLSNFLLWQAAYAELVFVDKYWPAFTATDLKAALCAFSQRSRRFGALSA